MLLSAVKPFSCRHSKSAAIANGSHSKSSSTTVTLVASKQTSDLPLQVKVSENVKPFLQKTYANATTSRREMMRLTGGSLCFLSLLVAESATAAPANANIFQNILEKLGLGGSSTVKKEAEEKTQTKDEEEKKSDTENGTEEKVDQKPVEEEKHVAMPQQSTGETQEGGQPPLP